MAETGANPSATKDGRRRPPLPNAPKPKNAPRRRRKPQKEEKPRWKEGVYTGERNDGKLRHGKGRIDWPNGDFYEGDFNDGLRSGKGVYSCKGGKHIYEGEWKL